MERMYCRRAMLWAVSLCLMFAMLPLLVSAEDHPSADDASARQDDDADGNGLNKLQWGGIIGACGVTVLGIVGGVCYCCGKRQGHASEQRRALLSLVRNDSVLKKWYDSIDDKKKSKLAKKSRIHISDLDNESKRYRIIEKKKKKSRSSHSSKSSRNSKSSSLSAKTSKSQLSVGSSKKSSKSVTKDSTKPVSK